MLFRQFFDAASSTFTYLLARAPGREAVLIDPVNAQITQYLTLIEQLDLRLVKAIDTHVHADHVTALGALSDGVGCLSVMGQASRADCVSLRVGDGDSLDVDGVRLEVLATPGHTDDSISLVLASDAGRAVFTGDVLLIRGTGRTDFQNGDAGQSWDSITGKLFRLGDATRVYPAHDYKGWSVSTIGEERRCNPRLAGKSRDEYIAIMDNLNLPRPKMMDVAVPANLRCGRDA